MILTCLVLRYSEYPNYSPGWPEREHHWAGMEMVMEAPTTTTTTTTSPSPAGTVDQELSCAARVAADNSRQLAHVRGDLTRQHAHARDLTRDSETDFTVDSEQSTTEAEFPVYNNQQAPSPSSREDSESPDHSGFRFERSGQFYKSTRFRTGPELDEDESIFRHGDYADMAESVSPGVGLDNIPEKYFITVSGFEDNTAPSGGHVQHGDQMHVSSTHTQKQRNVTEV